MNVVAMVVICESTEWTTYELTWEHNIKHGTHYLYIFLFAHTVTPATRTHADKRTKTYPNPFTCMQIDTHIRACTHTYTHTHTHIHTHRQTDTQTDKPLDKKESSHIF